MIVSVDAVVRTIHRVSEYRRRGQRGFHGACLEVDPDSSVVPWLIACRLALVLKGVSARSSVTPTAL